MTKVMKHQGAIVWALATLVVIAPHLLGGIFAWGTLSLAIGATLLAGMVAWAWSGPHAIRRPEPVAIVLGVVLLVTALQAMPLPEWLARHFVPDALQHSSDVHRLLGMSTTPRSVPMTLDPGRTHERVLYAVAVWSTFCVALLASTQRRTLVFVAVGISGVIIAVSDLGHLVFGATEVYGLYDPVYTPARGPILNPNNLAGMMAMATPVCLGLAVRTPATRVYWSIGAVITGATCLVANSRAGTAALAAGVALFAVLNGLGPVSARQAQSPQSNLLRRLGVAVIPMIALIMSFAVAHYAADTPLDTNYSNLTKLDMLRDEVTFLVDGGLRSLIGIGRGALPAVFSAARFPGGRMYHAENFLLQYAIDFGIPLALVVIAVVTTRVFKSLLRWDSVPQLGALCGCVAIGLQNAIDFSLELTGIAVPVAACLAAALADTSGRSDGRGAAGLAWLSAATGTIMVTLFGASALHNDAYLSQLDLEKRIRHRSGEEFWPMYRDSVLSHPADPGLAMLGASRKVRERADDAWPWIDRTLKLAPSWGAPQVLAALWLLDHGQQNRAVAALRAAAERDPDLSKGTMCEWLKRAPFAEVVFMVVPEHRGPQRETILNGGAVCLSAAPDQASRVDAVLLRENPGHLRASLREVHRQLARKENAAATTAARSIRQRYPDEAEPYQLEARGLVADGKPAAAVEVLREGAMRSSNRFALLLDLIITAARANDERAMRDAVEQVRSVSGGNPRQIAQALSGLSAAESSLGNHAKALRAARDAYDLAPEPSYLALAAGAAERLGQPAIALDAWTRACRESATPESYCRARDALTKRMQAQQPKVIP